LLNTSFNSHNEPIIDNPTHAFEKLKQGIIDKLVIDCTELIYSGGSPTFSFGISGLTASLEIAVSEISNKVKVFDLSNGLLDGTKSVTDTILSASLSGGTIITSGTVSMEVSLKLSID
jgi:hypothetical protein